MKNNKLPVLLLGLLFSTVIACGNTVSSTPGVSVNPSNGSNISSTPGSVDGTYEIPVRDNDFLEDEDLVDRDEFVEIVDNTPEDTGTLVEHRFEFESARYDGISNNVDHKCVAQSMTLNTAFGGNICMKNIAGGSSFTFTFTSDKDVRSPLIIKASNAYISGSSFDSAYEISINNNSFVSVGLVPTEGVVPEGLNETYFTMVDIDGKISMKKGENKLVIKSLVNSCPNLDSLIIKTSAEIKDTTVCNWNNITDHMVINTMPSDTSSGTVTYTCGTSGCTKKGTATIPNFKSNIYKYESNDLSDTRSILIGNEYQPLIQYNSLKLQKAKFDDGTTQKKLLKGSKPVIALDNPNEGMHVGWVNVDDEKETYPVEFVMPNKPLTIAPLLEVIKDYTLTLQNATFEDGTTSKKVMALEEVTLKVTNTPEGKSHVGWYNVNDDTESYNTIKFKMPAKDITIAPMFKPSSYVKSGSGYLDFGECAATSSSGYVDYISTTLKFAHSTETDGRVTGHIGNGEYGTILSFTNSAKGDMFRVKTNYNRVANVTYLQTYTIANLGDSAITFTVDQINTKTTQAGFQQKVTLEANARTTFTLEYKFDNDNNHLLTLFTMDGTYKNASLGISSSIVSK